MKFILYGSLSSALLVLFVAGCSSVPDFKPSKPVAEASSLSEALEICASYQIKGKVNEGGHGLPVRVSAITPWVNCFESVFRKFPAAADRQDLVMFFRALESRRAGVPSADAEVIDWQSMNFAVTRAVDHLKDEKLALAGYTEEERRVIEREFPGFAMYLAEHGAFDPAKKAAVTRRRNARGDLSIKGADNPATVTGEPSAPNEKLPPRPHVLTAEQLQYCKRYKDYELKLTNLRELQDYKRILEEKTYRDSKNSNEVAMLNRITQRVSNLELELQGKKGVLEKDLLDLQVNASWFRNGYCK